MNSFSKYVFGLVVLSVMVSAWAKDGKFAGIKNKLQAELNGMEVTAIANSPIEGLLQVVTNKGLFYVSEDGTYLMQGRIYNLNNQMRNESEITIANMRMQGVEKFKDSAIEFKAEKEQFAVSIFTDLSCGYCRKLHREMSEYNDAGITVRYLAFPRAGINSQSYQDMVSVWCATDTQKAMTQAQAGAKVPQAFCANEVAEQFTFGASVGVSATPNIIMPNGTLSPGYRSATQLLLALKEG